MQRGNFKKSDNYHIQLYCQQMISERLKLEAISKETTS
jgi:hypothetical protein